ncbi:hypothetical protein GQX73_g9370 [Xylaria multiplex]|uniref:Uncharacterized protein n=1 Tax=Xylaria multiplex TaxID=323545 RepID=A0A7C8II30_9PEZI|nr:hypothetical protein GQX73_g9370 [Xylaria multiplex]
MAPNVALQADISQTAIELLGTVTPILRALSSDNVHPLAVLQLDAIGSRFPISGPLAKQIPDALTRSSSVRLGRLQNLVGWMAGDTSAALCQSAGGQASALLTLCLVEMFCRNSTGHLLFDLSMRVLPKNRCLASMAQLSDLAEVVSNKLKPLAFGQHHAIQVTRIRETYLRSDIELPPQTSASLLERLTIDSMVELLDAVQQALQDSTLLLYIEGFQGLGGVVSLLMALCPDDVTLLIEGEVIFQGQRRTIIISVKHEGKTLFGLEKIIHTKKSSPHAVTFRPNEFLAHPGGFSSYDHLTMEAKGCLFRMAEQLLFVTKKPPQRVIASFVNLIGTIMLSFTGVDFGPGSDFPCDGLRLEFHKPLSISDMYTTQQLHADLCQLLGYIPSNAGEGQNVVGACSGSTSILPMTLGADSFIKGHLVRYRALDGQFHDGHSYYKAITENAHIQPRALARVSIQRDNTISPSAMGVHSNIILSLRPHHNSLTLRATVNFGTQMKEISFYDANLAYMATCLAHPCDHHPKDPVTVLDTASVIRTGVEAPVASDGRISVVLTHNNSEAQFLAGVRGVPSMYQGISCLGCMINRAKEGGFQLLIQS